MQFFDQSIVASELFKISWNCHHSNDVLAFLDEVLHQVLTEVRIAGNLLVRDCSEEEEAVLFLCETEVLCFIRRINSSTICFLCACLGKRFVLNGYIGWLCNRLSCILLLLDKLLDLIVVSLCSTAIEDPYEAAFTIA